MMEQVWEMYLEAQRQVTRATTKETVEYWRGKVDAYYSINALFQSSKRCFKQCPSINIHGNAEVKHGTT